MARTPNLEKALNHHLGPELFGYFTQRAKAQRRTLALELQAVIEDLANGTRSPIVKIRQTREPWEDLPFRAEWTPFLETTGQGGYKGLTRLANGSYRIRYKGVQTFIPQTFDTALEAAQARLRAALVDRVGQAILAAQLAMQDHPGDWNYLMHEVERFDDIFAKDRTAPIYDLVRDEMIARGLVTGTEFVRQEDRFTGYATPEDLPPMVFPEDRELDS